MISSKLLEFYNDEEERVGFILPDGAIVEVENVCAQPVDGFEISAEDLIEYGPRAAATWHTHPQSDANLSFGDYESFRSWPQLDHYIIAEDEVRHYYVENGEVLIAA